MLRAQIASAMLRSNAAMSIYCQCDGGRGGSVLCRIERRKGAVTNVARSARLTSLCRGST